MEVVTREISELRPYENNPRKNDHAVEAVARAIDTFGFRVPVLIQSDGAIIDGHLRYKAALHLGLTEVPCLVADDMSEAQIKAFRISVNKVAELADWDEELLQLELVSLRDEDFDLGLIGFKEHELDALLLEYPVEVGDKEAVPPLSSTSVSCEGDLWSLGRHRLLCGSSTSNEDMTRLVGDSVVDMVFTDPPYNVNYQGGAGKIKNDNMTDDEFDCFLSSAFSCMAPHLKNGGAVYVAHADAGRIGISFRSAFLNAGFKLAACLIWKKNQFTLGRSDYQWIHEPILYGWKEGAAHFWYGDRKRRTVLDLPLGYEFSVDENEVRISIGDQEIRVRGAGLSVQQSPASVVYADKPLQNKEHPTMKPVALVEKFVKNSSKVGESVLDGFGGSGSTLIACEVTGRTNYSMELDPRFCDVIVRRWQDLTGKNGCLSSGKKFTDVMKERA